MSLPTGTVTFLFTDIEGSTRLWEQYPDQMRQVLLRHDSLAEEIINHHGGSLIKERGEGDSLFAVFSQASQAIAAVCALQIAFIAESWPLPQPIRVRMALHTGEADLRDDGYYGSAVNRCARLRSIGHGGQVLVSRTTYDLVCDSLPAGASLRDSGQQRLRDLTRPEQVFQLLHPDLPSDFPPLTSLDALPNNLPQQLTSFIGREKEMAEVKRLLGGSRLLTLTGSGGCGKTRLALQVAADLLDSYPDGVWLVELASISESGLVPQAVASALHVREVPGKSLSQTLGENLKESRLLLVLDNCEHLINACAHFADALLRVCPDIRVLASSREAMGIAGEQTYRVPSLTLPNLKQDRTVESIGQYEAVQLFIARACLHMPDFAVTNENAPSLAAICHRLDGIPLAIELAAARVRSLSIEEVNDRLDQRFRLLTGGSRTALPRQQTLRSLIDWSYDLLSEAEKALLCRLSVFAGGWTLKAAEQVCSGDGINELEVLDLLTSLSDKSLLITDEHKDVMRYRLLETVRQYAWERLDESAQTELWQTRHMAFCLAMTEEAERHLRGPEQQQWLQLLEIEYNNLRVALEWSEKANMSPPRGNAVAESALRLAASLWRFWYVRGNPSEGRERLSRALAHDPNVDSGLTAKAMFGAGNLDYRQGSYASAKALLEASLAIRREMDDVAGIAASLNSLGFVSRELSDYAAARLICEECLSATRKLGDRGGIANALVNLGSVVYFHADYVVARELYAEGLAIHREVGDRAGISASLGNLGNVAKDEGEFAAARALYEESLTESQELGDRGSCAVSMHNLGLVAFQQGDYPGARAHHSGSLRLFQDLGDRWGTVNSLEALSCVAAACADPLRAARQWGAAERLHEEIGAPLPPSEQARYERLVAAARGALADQGAFDRAWQEGRAMSLQEAIEYAHNE